MNILLVLIPLSVLLALGAVIAFFWAVDHDQFDDMDTPKLLPLLDDPRPNRQDDTSNRDNEVRDTTTATNVDARQADADSKRPTDSERKRRR